ncbi:MAG: porin family protein [Saprospiraceae bacterium]
MFKKLIFTLSTMILFVISVKAQLGVRAGLNFSSTNIEFAGISASTDSKVGFHVGLVNDFMLSDKLTFRPGVLLSFKGGKSDAESTNLTYIDIPLSLVYNFSGGDTGFFAEVGPYLGFLLAAKSEDVDIKDGYKSLDLGLSLGLGYDLGSFLVGANYGLGLANVAEVEDGVDVSAKNNNIAVYGIYQF